MNAILKRIAWSVATVVVLPCALGAAFGRFRGGFSFFAHALASAPGLPGSYLRVAYYAATLQGCSRDSHIGFGSFFAHPEASVGQGVYIGAYCVLGRVTVGDRTHLASAVQILSGAHQHTRDVTGRISGSDGGSFETIEVESDCWIGAGSIVMANVQHGTTIGAGSVVTKPIPSRSLAVGSPARVIEKSLDG